MKLTALDRLLSFIPRRLPLGMTEFEVWSNRIIDLSGEFADRDSMKFALASNILHLGPQTSFKPDIYFIRSMQKAASNQVASQVFQDIKQRQMEAAKAKEEADKKARQEAEAEATAVAQAALASVPQN